MQTAEQMQTTLNLLKLQIKYEKNTGQRRQKSDEARKLQAQITQRRNEEKFT